MEICPRKDEKQFYDHKSAIEGYLNIPTKILVLAAAASLALACANGPTSARSSVNNNANASNANVSSSNRRQPSVAHAVNDGYERPKDVTSRGDVKNSTDKELEYHGKSCTVDCGGHEAGYEWAERKGITDKENCGGNSQSFIEGCESYVEENYPGGDSGDDDND